MAKYRKKPIVVDATKWVPGHSVSQPTPQEPDELGVIWLYDCKGQVEKGLIETREGGHEVTIGDWIITGIQGEKYPCKPQIFVATYDLVESSQ